MESSWTVWTYYDNFRGVDQSCTCLTKMIVQYMLFLLITPFLKLTLLTFPCIVLGLFWDIIHHCLKIYRKRKKRTKWLTAQSWS